MKQNCLYILFTLILSLGVGHLGGQKLSEVKDVDPIVKVDKTSIKVFPNPAMDYFNLELPTDEFKYITIHTILGKEVKKMKVADNGRYNVEELRRGVYIIRIINKQDVLVKAVRFSKV